MAVHVQKLLIQEGVTFEPVDFTFFSNPFSCILFRNMPLWGAGIKLAFILLQMIQKEVMLTSSIRKGEGIVVLDSCDH